MPFLLHMYMAWGLGPHINQGGGDRDRSSLECPELEGHCREREGLSWKELREGGAQLGGAQLGGIQREGGAQRGRAQREREGGVNWEGLSWHAQMEVPGLFFPVPLASTNSDRSLSTENSWMLSLNEE